jgi:flagellar biogenesis protein FliO
MLPLPATVEMSGLAGDAGVSWWQTLGGLIAVFGLLVISLRLLRRFQRRQGGDRAGLVAAWSLGPKREIQVLRLGETVHYVYRHDGAMVVLEQEPLADWQTRAAANPAPPGPDDHSARPGLRTFLARAVGHDTPPPAPSN